VHHDVGDGSTTTTTCTDDARPGYVRRLGGAHSPRRVYHGGARGRVKGTGGRRPSRRRVDAVPAAPGQAGPARGPPPRGSARGGTAARALSLSAPAPSPNRRRGRCDPPRMRRRVSERRGGAAPRQAGLSRSFWIRRRGRCIERPCGRVLPPADAGARRDASPVVLDECEVPFTTGVAVLQDGVCRSLLALSRKEQTSQNTRSPFLSTEDTLSEVQALVPGNTPVTPRVTPPVAPRVTPRVKPPVTAR